MGKKKVGIWGGSEGETEGCAVFMCAAWVRG